jgi:hypothetical protein
MGGDNPQHTLIVEYEDEAVAAAAAKAGVSTASVQTAAADASNKARDRGASAARRAEIVAIASQAAAVTPAVSAITYSMYLDAAKKGVEVTGVTNFATVMQGAAIRTNASDSAAFLKQELEKNPKVKKVWYAVSVTGCLELITKTSLGSYVGVIICCSSVQFLKQQTQWGQN